MKVAYNIGKSLFKDYDTVLFDLDLTIWECFNPMGESIPALTMEPPFELLEEGTVKDVRGNLCRLQEGVRDVLENLDNYGMNLGVVSASAQPDLADEAQPALMLLKKLDIVKFFTYIVVIKPKINKGDYARPDGRTLFIDDDPAQLQAVNVRGLVDVLSRKSFKDWSALFTESEDAKPLPTTLQHAQNAPQPTTSGWRSLRTVLSQMTRLSVPESYTDKSDIEGGIEGGSRSKSDMWHMDDHFEIDNGRDHVWGEPWEPQRQFFLDETKVTPKVDDKIRLQHPDKGGIAVSSIGTSAPSLAEEQLRGQLSEIRAHFKERITPDILHQQLIAYYGAPQLVSPERVSLLVTEALSKTGDIANIPNEEYLNEAFELGDEVEVEPLPGDDFDSFSGRIVYLPGYHGRMFFGVGDSEDNVWEVEAQQMQLSVPVLMRDGSLVFSDNGLPKAEQYNDYMGNTDVSPKDPKTTDEQAASDETRKTYYERGRHNTVDRPETDRPLTPFAGLKFGDIAATPQVAPQGTPQVWNEIGRCARCGSYAVEYGDSHHSGEVTYYEVRCEDCEWEGREWYAETYIETTSLDDEPLATEGALNFSEQPVDIELHKPNKIMTHQAVDTALTFAEAVKPRFVLNPETREDYKYVPPQRTAASTEDAHQRGQQLSVDEALALVDKWYTDCVQYVNQGRRDNVQLYNLQLEREALEARIGLGEMESIQGTTVPEKYQNIKQRLLDIKAGHVPDPMAIH